MKFTALKKEYPTAIQIRGELILFFAYTFDTKYKAMIICQYYTCILFDFNVAKFCYHT